MEVTILGSGSPLPQTSRGGQSIVVTIHDDPILIDCGPLTVERLLENGFTLANINTLFFTHQHMDHNASFFQFAISSWMYGRRSLSIYGPDGTGALLDALENIYAEDLAYRAEFGRPIEAITEIEHHQMTDKTRVAADDWEVKARPVEHSIETYAYRIKETATQASCVYSADTGDGQPLIDFARDADILVHDCGVGPALDAPSTGTRVDRNSWSQFLETNPRPEDTPIADQHCDSTQAAEIATEADVDTLVLTHFLPVRDTRKIRKQAEAIFSGDVLIAEDGLTLRR